MSDTVTATSTPGGVGPEPAIVDDTDQLTPAWFDAVLGSGGTGAAVRTVATEPVGTGQMAATVRARLGLDDGGERTVVVKYARGDVQSPMAALAYSKEVAFYAELGDRVAARTPGACTRRSPKARRASCSCSRTWPRRPRATRSPVARSPTPRPRS